MSGCGGACIVPGSGAAPTPPDPTGNVNSVTIGVPAPEPASVELLAAGLIGLAWKRRRTKR